MKCYTCANNQIMQFNNLLWNSKIMCFYQVTERQVEVWENKKCCGNMSRRQVFPQLFWVLSNFHKCCYNSTETQRTCFLFLLENNAKKKGKTICFFLISKCKLSLLRPSLHQQLVLVLCFFWVTKTRLLTNQGMNFVRAVF